MGGEIADKFRCKSRTVILNGQKQYILFHPGKYTDDPFPVHCGSSMEHRILDQRLQNKLGDDKLLKLSRNVDQELKLVFKAELLDESVLPDIGEIFFQGAERFSFQGHPLDVCQCRDGLLAVLRSPQADQSGDAV